MSRIIFGAEPLGGTDWGDADPIAAALAVRAALDLGITAFDVADVYGLGKAEEELARALGREITRVTVMTKGGVRWWRPVHGRARTVADGSPAYLQAAVHASLARLGLASIPIYFLHREDPVTPIEQSIRALSDLVRSGLIGAIGLSNVSLASLRRAIAVHPIAAVQVEYSLVNRAAESELIPGCARLGVPILAHGVLVQGLLTGKFKPDAYFSKQDRRHRLPVFAELARGLHEPLLGTLRVVASRHEATPAQVALSWALHRPGIHAVIVGARNPDQVRENVGALDLKLESADRGQLDSIQTRMR